MNPVYKITIEDCGRWFDDYVLTHKEGKKVIKVYVKSYAKDLPRKLVKLAKIDKYSAKAIIEIASNKSKSLKTLCEEITSKGSITKKQINYLLTKI